MSNEKFNVWEMQKLILGGKLLIDTIENNYLPTEEERQKLREYFLLLDKLEKLEIEGVEQ